MTPVCTDALEESRVAAEVLVATGNQLKFGSTSDGVPTSDWLLIAVLVISNNVFVVPTSVLVPYAPPKNCDSVLPVLGETDTPSIHDPATVLIWLYAATVAAFWLAGIYAAAPRKYALVAISVAILPVYNASCATALIRYSVSLAHLAAS